MGDGAGIGGQGRKLFARKRKGSQLWESKEVKREVNDGGRGGVSQEGDEQEHCREEKKEATG